MKMDNHDDIERLAELKSARDDLYLDSGETLEERFGPGSFGYHELLDRASILMNNWDVYIAQHPATLLDADRYKRAHEVLNAMYAFYQLVGAHPDH